jgi:hypothetical protein
MKLSPPKMITWTIALILLIVGILLYAGILSVAGLPAFWLVAIGLGLMLIATQVKGL